MLGADDEVGVERSGRARVGPLAVELVEEALDEVERRVRLDRLLAGPQPGERGQRRRRERRSAPGPARRSAATAGPGPRPTPRPRSGARPSASVEAGSARSTVMTAAGSAPVASRCDGIPVAGPEQVRDRRVRAVLDEVADPVAAVDQAAALAVDLAERRLAGDDALEAGRVGLGRRPDWLRAGGGAAAAVPWVSGIDGIRRWVGAPRRRSANEGSLVLSGPTGRSRRSRESAARPSTTVVQPRRTTRGKRGPAPTRGEERVRVGRRAEPVTADSARRAVAGARGWRRARDRPWGSDPARCVGHRYECARVEQPAHPGEDARHPAGARRGRRRSRPTPLPASGVLSSRRRSSGRDGLAAR